MTDNVSDKGDRNNNEVRADGGGRRKKNRRQRPGDRKSPPVNREEMKPAAGIEAKASSGAEQKDNSLAGNREHRNRNRPRRRPQAGQELKPAENNDQEKPLTVNHQGGGNNKKSGRRNFRNYRDKKPNYPDSDGSAVKSDRQPSVQVESSIPVASPERFRVNDEEADFQDEQAFRENELFETAAVWTWRPTAENPTGEDDEENEQIPVSSDSQSVISEPEAGESATVDSTPVTGEADESAEDSVNGNEGLIYGISLRNRRGIFSCRDTRVFAEGDRLIVKTSRGREFAVLCNAGLKSDIKREGDLYAQKIIRQASSDDIKNEDKNREKEQKACSVAERKIALLKLKMRIVETEYLFDGSRIIFYFVSPQKVDFRELVKILATEFRTRIELRQINPREYVGLKGAISPCGQICCCARFLSKTHPVDINMADNQRLGKNPAKLNGVCGRLKCCLRYENSFYTEAYTAVPPRNTCLVCANGKKGTVCGSSVFHDFVTVRWEDGGSSNLTFAEVKASRAVETNSTKKD